MTFVAATNNAAKLKEMKRILGLLGIEVITMKEAGVSVSPEEDGTTFAENARIKARAVCEACGLPSVADDSGICVDVLGGAPGIYSARYGGEGLDDPGRTLLLLENMKDVPDGLRTGRFVSAICVAYPDGSTVEAQGACEGHILREVTGENGFGYDPIFEDIHGYKFGVVSAEIKDGVSHRRAALDALVKKLEERNKE